jgi:hypothetical protein
MNPQIASTLQDAPDFQPVFQYRTQPKMHHNQSSIFLKFDIKSVSFFSGVIFIAINVLIVSFIINFKKFNNE